jgi:hypothetical protein
LVIKYSISARTALAADVNLVANASLTVPTGSEIIPIPVTVLSDSIVEEIEGLNIEITSIGTQVLNPPPSTTVYIDDKPTGGNTADAYSTLQNQTLEKSSERNVLSNDTTGLTSVQTGRPPVSGTVVWSIDGTFQYTPAPNFIGIDRFAYQAATPNAFSLAGNFSWKWLHPLDGMDPALKTAGFHASWMQPAFDDSTWQAGSGLMGYGVLGAGTGVPIQTNLGTIPDSNGRYTAYFRTTLNVPPNPPTGLSLSFTCDDAVIFYLNGSPLGRYAKAPIGTFSSIVDT